MKIAILSTLTYSCPPISYGGEIFWYDLCCSFLELGHEVTLYAASGSQVPPGGKLRYLPCTYGTFDVGAESRAVEWYIDEILSHDFILECSHARYVAEEIFCFHPELRYKVFNVLNGVAVPRIPYNIVVGSQKWQDLMEKGETQFKGTPWEEMYGSNQQPLNNGEILGHIHWACNTRFYTPGDAPKENYLLWMARPSPYKGLHKALLIAEKTGLPLKLVMPTKMEEHIYFSGTYSEPIRFAQERGAKIEIVHLPENSQHHILKRELYRRAKALLVPYESHEPFGLVLIEALSCDTPVIASDIGAFPEIIRHGETGYLCSNDEDFLFATGYILGDGITSKVCRDDAEKRWDRLHAAKKYLNLFERIKGGK